MSFPSHRHCSFIIVQNPKPRPLLCYREFCWFPFKLWLVSQMYKKSWRLGLIRKDPDAGKDGKQAGKRMGWLDVITDSMDRNLSKFWRW